MIAKAAANPHFWVVVVLTAILLFIYEKWPWRDLQFATGFWSHFAWLAPLNALVVEVELRYHLFGVLFLVPIVYASVALSWVGGVFAWALAMIWVLPTVVSWPNEPLLINLALLFLPVLLVAIVTGERRWRESERRHFAERERERQAYIAKLVETEESERGRIAQELHDETLQTLMVIANKADALALAGSDEEQIEGERWIKQQVLHTMDDLRRLSMNLRPSILDNFGLVSGVRWLINNSNSQNGCRLDITVNGPEHKLAGICEVTAFRVVQEAINNIQKHAAARSGEVTLDFEADRLLLRIQDDGVGFHPPERLGAFVSESKLGVIGMEQRVVSLGGELHLESYPGRGTRIWACVPYEPSIKIVESQKP